MAAFDENNVEALKARLQSVESELVELKMSSAITELELAKLKGAMFALTARFEAQFGDAMPVAVVPPPSPIAMNQLVALNFSGKCFDKNGLFYYIGSQAYAAPYTNPHLLEESCKGTGVIVSMSSGDDNDGCHRFVHHDLREHNQTNNLAGSWMQVDIGAALNMSVNHYCLRHGNGDGRVLLNWMFQGSCTGGADANDWVTLRTHVNDDKLVVAYETSERRPVDQPPWSAPFTTGHWPVEPSVSHPKGFRFFRILQTGKNSAGYDRLICSGIELYGSLTIKPNSVMFD